MRIISILLIMLLFSCCLFLSCDNEMCYVCFGSGRCYNCGYEKPVDGDECNVCHGARICINCRGSGRIHKNQYSLSDSH